MKKIESIKNQLSRMELKNQDLKIQMQEVIEKITYCNEFSYGDVANVKKLSRILDELLDEYSNNLTAINMIIWTVKEIEQNEN